MATRVKGQGEMKMNFWEKLGRSLMKDYRPVEREQYEFEHYTLIIEPKNAKM